MHFEAAHRFEASADAVMAVMVDAAFYLDLELPDLTQPEVVEARGGVEPLLRLRYEYIGQLDAIGRALLGGRALRWIQQVRLEPVGHTGELSFSSEDEPDRLQGSARLVFCDDGAETVRSLDGEMVVAVPIVGATAERHIVAGVLGRLDIEASAISARLLEPRNP